MSEANHNGPSLYQGAFPALRCVGSTENGAHVEAIIDLRLFALVMKKVNADFEDEVVCYQAGKPRESNTVYIIQDFLSVELAPYNEALILEAGQPASKWEITMCIADKSGEETALKGFNVPIPVFPEDE
jgi:hypothetical protein